MNNIIVSCRDYCDNDRHKLPLEFFFFFKFTFSRLVRRNYIKSVKSDEVNIFKEMIMTIKINQERIKEIDKNKKITQSPTLSV